MQLRGIKRKIASLTVLIPCALAHRVLVVSHELMEIDIREHLIRPKKACVIHHGSCNGVDTKRFSRNEKTIGAGQRIRTTWQIPQDALVLGFVGKISIEKGVCELAEAFKRLHTIYGDKLYLLIVGFFDYMGGMAPKPILQYLKEHSHIKCVGMIDDVENHYAAMDILVLPTYREGFGLSMIEAAALELPTIATEITGCVDAVVDGVTGLLVEVDNPQQLYEAMLKLVKNPELRKKLGSQGRQRVKALFDSRLFIDKHIRLYEGLIDKNV